MEITILTLMVSISIFLTYLSLSKKHNSPAFILVMSAIFWIFTGLSTIINVQYYFPNLYSFTIYTISGWAFQYLTGFIFAMYGFAILLYIVLNNLNGVKNGLYG